MDVSPDLRKVMGMLVRHEPGALAREVKVVLDHGPWSRPNACYNNAFMYASERPGCRYVLGYLFVARAIPVEHAWVWDPKRGHVEVTLPRIDRDAWVEMYRPGMDWALEFATERSYPPAAHDYRRARQQGARVDESAYRMRIKRFDEFVNEAAPVGAIGRFVSVENAVRYNRSKFNSLDHAGQEEYRKKVNAEKLVYNFEYPDGSMANVSKKEYDASDLPEGPRRDYREKA